MEKSALTSVPATQTDVWGKIYVLLWKNCLLQFRQKYQTIFSIFLPIGFFLLLAILPKFENITIEVEKPRTKNYTIAIQQITFMKDDRRKMAFTPNNQVFQALIDNIKKDWTTWPAEFFGVDDVEQLESIVRNKPLLAGIQFHHSKNITEMPKQLSYSIRYPAELTTMDRNWKTDFTYSSFIFKKPRQRSVDYYNNAFLHIQNAISYAFIQYFDVKRTTIPRVSHDFYFFPLFAKDENFEAFQFLIPLFIVISFNYTHSSTIHYIVVEKKKQFKKSLKVMGIPIWTYWLSWFMRTMLLLAISITIVVLLIKVPVFNAPKAVLPNSNYFLLWLFLFVYCISLTTFSFLCSTMFSAPESAVPASIIIWYLSFLPFTATEANYEYLSGLWKVLLCLFPNTAMGYAIKIIFRHEEMGIVFSWSTLFRSHPVFDSLTVGIVMCMMLLNSVLFMSITLSTEYIASCVGGMVKPWNRFNGSDSKTSGTRHKYDKSNFENESENLEASVEIIDLCKAYGKEKLAVNNLSLKIYVNQITVLLGPMESGKTTTISMLAGLISPSSGTALINGYDMRKKSGLARKSMGFCPHRDILFGELTVRENILFYSRLKGLSKVAANEDVAKYVSLFQLEDKRDAIISNLSDGMQRQLSIAVALCGQSKIVFCDDPSSGLDLVAKKVLWNVLLAEKRDRVIIVTTQCMDEAETIGDRIAILANGELKCCGSPSFLKERFGGSYRLVCVKNYDCNSKLLTYVVKTYFRNIVIESETENEVSYRLAPKDKHKFKRVFQTLEINFSRLKLKCLRVFWTPVDEIFHSHPVAKEIPEAITNRDTCLMINDNEPLLLGIRLILNQIVAMFKKRSLYWVRDWCSFIYYNIAVILLLLPMTTNLFLLFVRIPSQLPPLEMSLDPFVEPYFAINENSFSNPLYKNICQILKENLKTLSPKATIENTTDTYRHYLINFAKSSLATYFFQHLFTFEIVFNSFGDDRLGFMHNIQFYHLPAVGLNVLNNAMIGAILGSEYSNNVTNAPFKFVEEQNITNAIENFDKEIRTFGLQYPKEFSILIAVLMSIFSSSYIIFYAKENKSNAKFMQYVSGVNLIVFWISSILWDLLTNMLTMLLIVIILYLSDQQWNTHLSDMKFLGTVFFILFMFNYAMMPIICLLSLFCPKPTIGSNVLFAVGMFLTMVFFINNYWFQFLPKFISTIMLVFPICALVDCFTKLFKIGEICAKYCDEFSKGSPNCDHEILCEMHPDCCPQGLFSWNENGIAVGLLFMFFVNLVAIIILLLIEYGLFSQLIAYVLNLIPRSKSKEEEEEEEDDDEHVDDDSVKISMQNVSKRYGRLVAVNRISLKVKEGQCLGLIGNVGAGKTSLIKMLSCKEQISDGTAFLDGLNLKLDVHKVHKIISYCPQSEAHLYNLTARETLEIFALLRGVPWKEVKNYVLCTSSKFNFAEHLDTKIVKLSNCHKRTLNTAIALTGNFAIILLDQPFIGIDQVTRRKLWKVLLEIRDQDKLLILTSDSMKDYEELCTHSAFMKYGKIEKLLQNEDTEGIEIKIEVLPSSNSSDLNGVKDFISSLFNEVILKDEKNGILIFHIPNLDTKWSEMFGVMEKNKRLLHIKDYSCSISKFTNMNELF